MTYHVQFPGLGLALTVNRVAVSIGGFNIYWYGVIIAAGMMQQFSSYASTGALGAAVGAMGVTVCMIGQLFGKFGLGWLCDHTGARVSGVVASIFGAAGIAIAGGKDRTGLLGELS